MRSRGLFWGVFVILFGIALLLSNLGLLPSNFWGLFWPMILILAGVWFLVGPMIFKRQPLLPEPVSIPLEGAQRAEIRLDHGAGRLEINALPASVDLISGTATGGLEQNVHREGDLVRVRLSASSDLMFFPGGPQDALHWNLGLNRTIPTALELHTGASDSILDLSNLLVTDLKIETGASATEIAFPSAAGLTRATIKSGAASVKIRIPEGVAGRIKVQSGLAGISVDQARFPQGQNGYETPGYEGSVNRAEIFIETGVGSVEIR